jgi:hypothetical protein
MALIAGRPLACETSGHDRYHRVLDINVWMVQQGWGLAYYSRTDMTQEAAAHAAKRGIWASSFCRLGSGRTGISIEGISAFLEQTNPNFTNKSNVRMGSPVSKAPSAPISGYLASRPCRRASCQ